MTNYNGGIIGAYNQPDPSGVSGVWSLDEVNDFNSRKDWPREPLSLMLTTTSAAYSVVTSSVDANTYNFNLDLGNAASPTNSKYVLSYIAMEEFSDAGRFNVTSVTIDGKSGRRLVSKFDVDPFSRAAHGDTFSEATSQNAEIWLTPVTNTFGSAVSSTFEFDTQPSGGTISAVQIFNIMIDAPDGLKVTSKSYDFFYREDGNLQTNKKMYVPPGGHLSYIAVSSSSLNSYNSVTGVTELVERTDSGLRSALGSTFFANDGSGHNKFLSCTYTRSNPGSVIFCVLGLR